MTPSLLFLLLAPTADALPQSLADAVATGDCTAVLAAIPSPKTDEEKLAVGWCKAKLASTGALLPFEALKTLDGIGEGVYGDYSHLVRARILDQTGAPGAEVAAALKGLDLPGAAGRETRLLRAKALSRTYDYDAGRKALVALFETDVAGEARVALGDSALQNGRIEPAVEVWRNAWAKNVAGSWDDVAAERLKKQGQDPEDLTRSANHVYAKLRVGSLRKANQHGEALKLALALADHGVDALTGTALAHAYFRGRDYAGSTAQFEKALGAPAACTGSPKDLFHYALGVSRTGDYDSAAVIYDRLRLQHPADGYADTASFKLGYLDYDRNRCAQALPLFEAHIKRYPKSKHLDEALWFAARCGWKSGNTAQAIGFWDRLVNERPKSSLAPGAAYWKARAAEDDAALANVVNRWPTSGYAWFAAQRTGRVFEQKPVVARPEWPAALAARTDVKRAEALLGSGFQAWARDELGPVAPVAKESGRTGALAAAHAFIAVGDYKRGRKLARPYCVSVWKTGDPVAQQACTPRPEASIVAAAAGRYGLDPLVPFGIMTAESALDPSVTSIAGARGLMQLMPIEAEVIHNEAFGKARPYDPTDLYAAPYNAAMGTTELGMKHRVLDGRLLGTHLPASIASYNGGIEAVERWLATYDETPEFDEFSEDISYSETRRYVKRVLGFTMQYRWVYGDEPFRP